MNKYHRLGSRICRTTNLTTMRIQKIYNKFNLRTISAAICVSLVSSCAYESYPMNSSYGGGGSPYGTPYGNSRTVSDPTVPLILGASAIGAIAYFGKKSHDRRHSSHRNYNNYRGYSNNSYNRRSNHYSSNRNHNVHYNSSRNNHTSSYHRSNRNPSSHSSHNNHNRSSVRDSYRNSAREALERKRSSQRSTPRNRPQTTRPHHSQVVSTSSSRGSRGSSSSRPTRSRSSSHSRH